MCRSHRLSLLSSRRRQRAQQEQFNRFDETPRILPLSSSPNRLGQTGAYMQPTILTNVSPDNPAYRQEFFGPVALFFTAKDDDEAIAIANDSPFGLGSSVYTSDIEHGK